MSSKKKSKIYAFNKQTGMSTPTKKSFLVITIAKNKIDNIGVYDSIEEAESKLIEELKMGTCCWIGKNNE